MADLADVIIGYDAYPHVDMNERGQEAIELLARIVRNENLYQDRHFGNCS